MSNLTSLNDSVWRQILDYITEWDESESANLLLVGNQALTFRLLQCGIVGSHLYTTLPKKNSILNAFCASSRSINILQRLSLLFRDSPSVELFAKLLATPLPNLRQFKVEDYTTRPIILNDTRFSPIYTFAKHIENSLLETESNLDLSQSVELKTILLWPNLSSFDLTLEKGHNLAFWTVIGIGNSCRLTNCQIKSNSPVGMWPKRVLLPSSLTELIVAGQIILNVDCLDRLIFLQDFGFDYGASYEIEHNPQSTRHYPIEVTLPPKFIFSGMHKSKQTIFRFDTSKVTDLILFNVDEEISLQYFTPISLAPLVSIELSSIRLKALIESKLPTTLTKINLEIKYYNEDESCQLTDCFLHCLKLKFLILKNVRLVDSHFEKSHQKNALDVSKLGSLPLEFLSIVTNRCFIPHTFGKYLAGLKTFEFGQISLQQPLNVYHAFLNYMPTSLQTFRTTVSCIKGWSFMLSLASSVFLPNLIELDLTSVHLPMEIFYSDDGRGEGYLIQDMPILNKMPALRKIVLPCRIYNQSIYTFAAHSLIRLRRKIAIYVDDVLVDFAPCANNSSIYRMIGVNTKLDCELNDQ